MKLLDNSVPYWIGLMVAWWNVIQFPTEVIWWLLAERENLCEVPESWIYLRLLRKWNKNGTAIPSNGLTERERGRKRKAILRSQNEGKSKENEHIVNFPESFTPLGTIILAISSRTSMYLKNNICFYSDNSRLFPLLFLWKFQFVPKVTNFFF